MKNSYTNTLNPPLASELPPFTKELVQKHKFFNKKYKNPPLASEFPPLQRGIKGDLKSFQLNYFHNFNFLHRFLSGRAGEGFLSLLGRGFALSPYSFGSI